MREADIDYSDIPPLDKSFFKRVTVVWPPIKKQLTIRIDADVLAWLRAQGKGYQTRINHILRMAMDSQRDGSNARAIVRKPRLLRRAIRREAR